MFCVGLVKHGETAFSKEWISPLCTLVCFVFYEIMIDYITCVSNVESHSPHAVVSVVSVLFSVLSGKRLSNNPLICSNICQIDVTVEQHLNPSMMVFP